MSHPCLHHCNPFKHYWRALKTLSEPMFTDNTVCSLCKEPVCALLSQRTQGCCCCQWEWLHLELHIIQWDLEWLIKARGNPAWVSRVPSTNIYCCSFTERMDMGMKVVGMGGRVVLRGRPAANSTDKTPAGGQRPFGPSFPPSSVAWTQFLERSEL